MDPAVETILQVSDRDFLHDVLRKLCVDNGFVRQSVLEHFAALPSAPSQGNAGDGNANAGDDQDPGIAANVEGTQSDNQDVVKPETAHGRKSSLYNIPLAPSALRAPSAPTAAPVPPAVTTPFRVVTRSQVNTPANSIMVIGDDNDVPVTHDDGDESYAASSSSSDDDDDGDVNVDEVLNDILDVSDGLSTSPGEERPRPTIERRLSPTFFNFRDFAHEEQFGAAPADRSDDPSRPRPEAAENKTRKNLYQTIYKHQGVSEKIDRLTKRLANSKDPAEIQLTSQRLQILDTERRGCREAIESVLSAEERETPESRRAALSRYHQMAAEDWSQYLAQSQSRKRNAPDDNSHENEHETVMGRRARMAREAHERNQRRLEENREQHERIERLTLLHDIAKQAARKGAKRLKLAEKAEARRVREVKARKRREAQEERAAMGRGRGRGRQYNASATPARRMPGDIGRGAWGRNFSY
ncbi:hypothetical protein PGQ11_010438 [Apiospora arundinis]|uniref:Uncharacterized protein n=1 Tax=Apiospora arundinis TaxID=335852 RepID=A0ABR2I9M9_9PEZI